MITLQKPMRSTWVKLKIDKFDDARVFVVDDVRRKYPVTDVYEDENGDVLIEIDLHDVYPQCPECGYDSIVAIDSTVEDLIDGIQWKGYKCHHCGYVLSSDPEIED